MQCGYDNIFRVGEYAFSVIEYEDPSLNFRSDFI